MDRYRYNHKIKEDRKIAIFTRHPKDDLPPKTTERMKKIKQHTHIEEKIPHPPSIKKRFTRPLIHHKKYAAA